MRMIGSMKEWTQEQHEINDDDDLISADAISDLSSTDNCISTWYVGDGSEEEIQKGVQALTSSFKSLDMVKVVLLDFDEIDSNFDIDETEGDTKIKEYANLHRDISKLNAGKIKNLAKLILEGVWNEKTKTITKEEVSIYLLQAMNEQKLEFSALNKNMRAALASSIKKLTNTKKIDKNDIPDNVWYEIEQQLIENKKITNCRFEKECERYNKKSR